MGGHEIMNQIISMSYGTKKTLANGVIVAKTEGPAQAGKVANLFRVYRMGERGW
jgi:hypothetical protein